MSLRMLARLRTIRRDDTDRWISFTDRDLREIYLALASSPESGSMRSNAMLDEITIEANRRGRQRAEVILS
jgi:hypothetical protein